MSLTCKIIAHSKKSLYFMAVWNITHCPGKFLISSMFAQGAIYHLETGWETSSPHFGGMSGYVLTASTRGGGGGWKKLNCLPNKCTWGNSYVFLYKLLSINFWGQLSQYWTSMNESNHRLWCWKTLQAISIISNLSVSSYGSRIPENQT